MTREPGKEHSRSHGQERTHRRNTHRRPDGEIRSGDEIATDPISDQEIEDDYIQQAREQARRVRVATNGPIHVDRQNMGDESGDPDQWQYDPVAAETVKENVVDPECSNKPSVEPKDTPPS